MTRTQTLGELFDRTGARPEPLCDLRDRLPATLQRGAPRARPRLFVGPHGQASLDFRESRREHRAPLLDRSTPQLVVTAQRRSLRTQVLHLGTVLACLIALLLGGRETRPRVRLLDRSARARPFQLVGARG